ncbi:helix-turn-helix domain-containing protein [Novosphingobium sp. CF614]|uniref:winged helix-turn-helix transcriptional regulator n=1 Tax=Novosphingobium sp. CF614 TaxID=1884364 RepID=UPI00210094A5|nr:helix-turn-helix domain-containing protein [Novosphingobium sp. CF614]
MTSRDGQHDEALARLRGEMKAHGHDREAPSRSVMGMLGDRWTMLILILLKLGEWRHAELRRTMISLSSEQAISQRVLTMKLRALERDGFVLRSVSDDVPLKVTYSLSPMGRDLAERGEQMIAWINARADAIHAARIACDAASED